MKTCFLATVGALLLVPALALAGQPDRQPQSQPAVASAYQGSVPVSSTIPGSNPSLPDRTMFLVNQTGGGR